MDAQFSAIGAKSHEAPTPGQGPQNYFFAYGTNTDEGLPPCRQGPWAPGPWPTHRVE